MSYSTEQEAFWAGDFGDQYINRNDNAILFAARLHVLSNATRRLTGVTSCIELGANIGLNLKALALLYPNMELHAVEINKKAASLLSDAMPEVYVHETSILDFQPTRKYDLVMISGVLIHQAPEVLARMYKILVDTSSKYIFINEYYNPTPVELEYRGHSGRMYKRDFAGELMDAYKELELIDYGFQYRSDSAFPADDMTWFLMKKESR